jgi:preprotein translocase subunit SecA
METLGLPYGEAIEHKYISSAIERAQKKVEERNFGIRKQVLEYDDIMNQQRIAIYEQRQRVLNRENLRKSVLGMAEDIITDACEMFLPMEKDPVDWEFDSLISKMNHFFPFNLTKSSFEDSATPNQVQEKLIFMMTQAYEAREAQVDPELMRKTEQIVVLRVVDNRWKEHLSNMDILQEGIWTRAYGQKDPLTEYKFEALRCYQEMIQQVREEVVDYIFKIQFDTVDEEVKELKEQKPEYFTNKDESAETKKVPMRRSAPKIKANSPCPCGSGKKYKKCCGLGKV